MYGQNDRQRDRQTDRQTDRPHELHVYVGLAQARPKYIALLGAIIFIAANKSVIVIFNYHVLFTFVINVSMKLCVSESLL